jgi:hypothetical protein
VGRGCYVIGEAIQERLAKLRPIHHIPIEELVSSAILNEDVKRYRLISTYVRPLLYLVYKIPIFYYRKYLREKWFSRADLHRLEDAIESRGIRTVLCVSHRPAFWVSALKHRRKWDLQVWAVGVELGRSLGWRYQFWDQIDGVLSPVTQQEFGVEFGAGIRFHHIELPVPVECSELARTAGNPDDVLLVCGAWGQGPLTKIVHLLARSFPGLRIHSVCGENSKAYQSIRAQFASNRNVLPYQTVPTLEPLLRKCASIITKPGISTILTARAARRKIFLIKGMPVAEDNNARYAIKNFDAEWFKIEAFRQWRQPRTGEGRMGYRSAT